jgi:hypothetical protein
MSTQKRSTLVYNDELKALMSEMNARIEDCRTLVSAPVVANTESTARVVRELFRGKQMVTLKSAQQFSATQPSPSRRHTVAQWSEQQTRMDNLPKLL